MIRASKATPEQVAEFEAQQARIREQMGFKKDGAKIRSVLDVAEDAGREPAMCASMPSTSVHETMTAQVCSYLPPATAMLLRLVIAHDGSLAAALSKAIVARAGEIGVAKLADDSPRSMRPKG